NNEAFKIPMPTYWCPSDPSANSSSNSTSYRAIHGGGVAADAACTAMGGFLFYTNGILHINSKVGFGDITDGSSNVIMVGESAYHTLKENTSVPEHAMGWASSTSVQTDGSITPTLAATF